MAMVAAFGDENAMVVSGGIGRIGHGWRPPRDMKPTRRPGDLGLRQSPSRPLRQRGRPHFHDKWPWRGLPPPGMKMSWSCRGESLFAPTCRPSPVTRCPSRIFTINAHNDGFSPSPGMKIGLKTADCPLPTIFTTKKPLRASGGAFAMMRRRRCFRTNAAWPVNG